jgi:hypothetical protein
MSVYAASIQNDKLVMTDVIRNSLSEIPLAVLGTVIGALEEETLGHADDPYDLTVHFRDQQQTALLFGVTLEKLKDTSPNFVELEAMTCTIPMEIMFHDEHLDQEGTDVFIRATFADVAAGRASQHGYRIRALVNSTAVDSIEDAGCYRDIHLKPEFGKHAVVHTPLSAAQITAALKMNGPA